jgi:hypothetical protein
MKALKIAPPRWRPPKAWGRGIPGFDNRFALAYFPGGYGSFR